jgi:hypothetical protein
LGCDKLTPGVVAGSSGSKAVV